MRRGYRVLSTVVLAAALLLASAPAHASFFDVFLESWSPAPPYPTTTPVRFAVFDDLGAGQAQIQTLKFGVNSAGQVGGDLYSTLGSGRDSEPTPGLLAPDSFFDVFLESATPAPVGGQPTVSSFFDIFTEIVWSAGQRGQLVPINGDFPASDPRHWVTVRFLAPDSFFDVFLCVAVPELPGQVIEYHSVYQLSDAVIAAGGSIGGTPGLPVCMAPDSFFDVFLELCCSASLPAGAKVFTVTTTAQRLTAPVAAERTTWGRLKEMYR